MAYVLIERQSGGCDYTIGCGLRVTNLKATTLAEAQEEAVSGIGDAWQAEYEYGIQHAELLEVTSSVDLASLLNQRASERRQVKAREDAAETETAERALLEKLQKKYG